MIYSNLSSGYGIAFAGQGHHRGGIYAENFGGINSHVGQLTLWARSGGNIILNAGKVGVGTTTPDEKLTVNGNINVTGNNRRIYLGGYGGTTFGLAYSKTYPDYGIFYTEATIDYVSISPNGNSKNGVVNVYGDGKVGIGTTKTGTHKLAVNGTIGAREIKVEATGWSDFVFEDNYKLEDLEEVESFIKDNKHLPDVPSEKEVLKNGIQLGEMDAKLLQKIEELTLYVIEQNKTIKEMQEVIERNGLK